MKKIISKQISAFAWDYNCSLFNAQPCTRPEERFLQSSPRCFPKIQTWDEKFKHCSHKRISFMYLTVASLLNSLTFPPSCLINCTVFLSQVVSSSKLLLWFLSANWVLLQDIFGLTFAPPYLQLSGAETLGTGGRSPKKFEMGDGPCIGPPIFREVVLSDARERMNRVNKWSYQGILF